MAATPSKGAAQRSAPPPGVEVHLPSGSLGLEADSSAEPIWLRERLREVSAGLGFCATGFTSVSRLEEHAGRLARWIDRGFHGEMSYLDGECDRADPASLLEGAASLVVGALPYLPAGGSHSTATESPVAAFALGRDYHIVIKEKLSVLAQAAADLSGRPVRARPCADTAPLLERAVAQRAGVGFIGRSTMLIVPGCGSRVTLGTLVLDLPLPSDPPLPVGCENCDACIRACPTGALVEPFTLDARRCVSYLTVESSGFVPAALRPLMGRRVFGCDACQDACPHNGAAMDSPSVPEFPPRSALGAWNPADLLAHGSSEHRRLVRGTTLHRISRNRLARNAAVALGNGRDRGATATLIRAVQQHPSGLVRAHAAWALGRLADASCLSALERAAAIDPDADVRTEAAQALQHLRRDPGN